jgi:hypothetical protein
LTEFFWNAMERRTCRPPVFNSCISGSGCQDIEPDEIAAGF